LTVEDLTVQTQTTTSPSAGTSIVGRGPGDDLFVVHR
jgi:hypothetical protein